jgi:hypothetical protein
MRREIAALMRKIALRDAGEPPAVPKPPRTAAKAEASRDKAPAKGTIDIEVDY